MAATATTLAPTTTTTTTTTAGSQQPAWLNGLMAADLEHTKTSDFFLPSSSPSSIDLNPPAPSGTIMQALSNGFGSMPHTPVHHGTAAPDLVTALSRNVFETQLVLSSSSQAPQQATPTSIQVIHHHKFDDALLQAMLQHMERLLSAKPATAAAPRSRAKKATASPDEPEEAEPVVAAAVAKKKKPVEPVKPAAAAEPKKRKATEEVERAPKKVKKEPVAEMSDLDNDDDDADEVPIQPPKPVKPKPAAAAAVTKPKPKPVVAKPDVDPLLDDDMDGMDD